MSAVRSEILTLSSLFISEFAVLIVYELSFKYLLSEIASYTFTDLSSFTSPAITEESVQHIIDIEGVLKVRVVK